MKICLEGAQLFLSYLNKEILLEDVINHESYQTVFKHGKYFGNELNIKDVEDTLEGKPSPFYGLTGLESNLDSIKVLINIIKDNELNWIKIIKDVYSPFIKEDDLDDVTIYPIIGYDSGIGFDGNICMNLNYEGYLNKPSEFLNMIIHEIFHVIYDKYHIIPHLNEIKTSKQWLNYYKLFFQNEGYAVYLPLKLRLENGDVFDETYFTIEDYTIILDNEKINNHISSFLKVIEVFQANTQLSESECINYAFGPCRYTYRVGCELIRRIESTYGLTAVKEGMYLEPIEFFNKYIHLIKSI